MAFSSDPSEREIRMRTMRTMRTRRIPAAAIIGIQAMEEAMGVFILARDLPKRLGGQGAIVQASAPNLGLLDHTDFLLQIIRPHGRSEPRWPASNDANIEFPRNGPRGAAEILVVKTTGS